MRAAPSFMKRSALLLTIMSTIVLFGSTAFAASAPHIHISNNWAGYAARGDTYTGVSAMWNVPNSSKTSDIISADATWVGIGGIAQDDLIQAGTQAVIRGDKTQYIAWYELLPDTQHVIPLVINPGDRIFASVNEISSGVWRITLSDLTTGKWYQTKVPYHSARSSAEWIVERPLANTGKDIGYLPLSNFGDLTFQNTLLTTASGTSKSVSTSNAEQFIMSDSNSNLIAAPQDGTGNSFTVSYFTPSQGSYFMNALRQQYTIQPETNATSRTAHYEEINPSLIINVIFSSSP